MSHILNWNVNLQLRMNVCDGQFHSWLLWPATSKIPPQNIIGKQFLRKRTVAKDCPLQNTKTTNLSVLMRRNTELNNAQDRETIKKWIYQTHRREIFPISDLPILHMKQDVWKRKLLTKLPSIYPPSRLQLCSRWSRFWFRSACSWFFINCLITASLD